MNRSIDYLELFLFIKGEFMGKQRYKGDVYEELCCLEEDLERTQVITNKQRNNIKRLMVLLIENDIPIPEDLINSYIQKTKEPKSMSQFVVVDDELPFY